LLVEKNRAEVCKSPKKAYKVVYTSSIVISLDPFYSTESTSSVIKTLDPQLSGPSVSLVETEDTPDNNRKRF
jgi:hypothetical protein